MMQKSTGPFFSRLADSFRRRRSYLFGRRPKKWPAEKPFISFTFDDFPRSAILAGGKILEKYKLRGSYYASLGFMGKTRPSGDQFTAEDLREAIAEGHEVGCHTFDHLNAWGAEGALFEDSILLNQEAMRSHFPEYKMRTFSYPFREPHPEIKKRAGKHYVCCRGGGQALNKGKIDLNLLKSCFIDYRNREDPDYFRGLIEGNSRKKGWLIFSCHDLGPNPSSHGCTPEMFERIVSLAVESGAQILPVYDVYSRAAQYSAELEFT